jgi:peptide/nickel transport system permease protein
MKDLALDEQSASVPQGWWGRWKEENASRINETKRSLYRFRQSRLSIVGLIMVTCILLIAIFGPPLVPYPGDATGAVHVRDRLLPPGAEHYFGTDDVGRDVFSRVIVGSRYSLISGVVVLVIAISIGVTLGAIAGYFGGRINTLIMRFTDVFFTIPALILALAISAALGRGLIVAMAAIALVWWPGYCRLTQGEVLATKEKDYVEAARGLGASHARITLQYILPNCISPIIVKASLDMGFAILTTASLGFIGVGAQPPIPDWGVMVSKGRSYLPDYWWYSTFPGLAIFIVVLGFNLLGDGLRDIFDPRTRR